jgi:UDP:flavonoid glycosyltransferase YjiC (YdhE family)
MSRTRVLFLPAFFGFPSHFITLLKLYQRLPPNKYDVAFLVPRLTPAEIEAQTTAGFNAQAAYYYSSEFLSHFDLPVLDLKQQFSVINELAAYRKFSPDVVVDDCTLTTALARYLEWRPRIAVTRTGVFGNPIRRWRHRSTLDSTVESLRAPPPLRFQQPESLDGYFDAEVHLIPGTRTVEWLPCLPHGGARAFYSGPLMLDEREELLFHSEPLAQFMEANRGRRIAYVTFGIDASRSPHPQVQDCLRHLLYSDFAVVTNVRLVDPSTEMRDPALRERYFHSLTVPMHYVCSRASLIVHVCGGMYHYPILHGKPAITIGTQCRDRELIAQTLRSLGLSEHLAAPAETDTFVDDFVDALDRYQSGRPPFDAGLADRLAALRREVEAIAASFNMEAAIDSALSVELARGAVRS